MTSGDGLSDCIIGLDESGAPILPYGWLSERVDNARLDGGGVLISTRTLWGSAPRLYVLTFGVGRYGRRGFAGANVKMAGAGRPCCREIASCLNWSRTRPWRCDGPHRVGSMRTSCSRARKRPNEAGELVGGYCRWYRDRNLPMTSGTASRTVSWN